MNDRQAGFPNRPGQRGVTLIEVLIAVVVLSIGLLGIVGLQTAGMQTSLASYQYSQATAKVQGMLERMRANRAAAQAGTYDVAAGSAPANPAVNCASAVCTSAQQAAWDLAVFFATVVGQPGSTTSCPGAPSGTAYSNIPAGATCVLPGAKLSIVCADATCTTSSPHLVTIYWDANRTGATGTGCDPTSSSDLRCYRLAFVP